MESLYGLLLMIDTKTWYIIFAVLAVLCLVSLIKKAARLFLTFLMVLLLAFGASYVRTNILDANNIKIEDQRLYVMDKAVEISNIQNIEIRQIGESRADVILHMKDGSSVKIEMPDVRTDVLKAVGSVIGVDTVEKKVQ